MSYGPTRTGKTKITKNLANVPKHGMCSTVLIRWITKVWEVSSKVSQLLDHGVALMSLTD
jgi:AAA+ superfamily predicted ATPase